MEKTNSESNFIRQPRRLDSVIKETLSVMESSYLKKDSLTGVPSGFKDLDRITGGWQKQDLVIIAARPAMGKTAFVLTCARNAAVNFKRPVAVFSLETSGIQLVNRLISGETEIEQDKIRKGNLAEWEWQQLHSKVGTLAEAPLLIDDTPALNILEFKEKCKSLKSEYDIQVIIVDYIQLMHSKKNNNREQEIGDISRELKTVARELDITIIAVSQLSRAVESRPGPNGKRPMLSDLRESGSIEQDADMVLFLYRPEYYGLSEDENGRSTAGIGEVIIAKHRNGETGIVPLRFMSNYVKFTDLEDSQIFENNSSFANEILSHNFDNPIKNVIIKPTKMDDYNDEDAPF